MDDYSLNTDPGDDILYHPSYSGTLSFEEIRITLKWRSMLSPGAQFVSVIPLEKVPASRTIMISMISSDGNNAIAHIKPLDLSWFKLLSSSKPSESTPAPSEPEVVKQTTYEPFGGYNTIVVMKKPLAISAGDSIGHMGLYQHQEGKKVKNRYIRHFA